MAVTCHRSTLAAPAVATRTLAGQRPVTDFIHVACSGDTVSKLLGTSGQLVSAAGFATGPIDALIISIGGNDIGFAKLVGACLALPCTPAIPAVVPASIGALSSALSSLVTTVSGLRVPVRHVFVTGYPDPSTTPFGIPFDRCGTGVTLNIPGFGFDLMDASKAQLASTTVIDPLNAVLAATVASANASTPPGGPVWHFVGGYRRHFTALATAWAFPIRPGT
jgi:hypothetical protein